ncbi:GNAT family N-acetyltransferase [Caldilinea sp.]|uniref:GNAT family N-acetyltransferase n=1 Tax=Caldilinea sp. TaxID=2293560 RepID=UPI002BB41A28|nr:GNAT family N-acetyltransferase [Anaerolineales bacterium]HQY90855.1 GNAT family N-acetyltransferase [Caldilinea sp.]
MTDPATILTIETIAANAWPAAESAACDGWRLRSTAGVTRRANSVWPNGDDGALSLAAKLAHVEAFYAARSLPAVYQICDAMRPAQLDDELAARGYTIEALTHVQTAPLKTMLERLPSLRHYPTFEVEVSEEFDALWFDLYCASEAVSGAAALVRRAILERITAPHGLVVLRCDGEPAAVGMGVVEAGWLGIFSMTTLPAFRRQGAARAILRTLAVWAQLYEARHAYLQVMVHNTAAQQLYAGAGFATAYNYHYRVKQNGDLQRAR